MLHFLLVWPRLSGSGTVGILTAVKPWRSFR
jgi:hypothetical protein